MDQDIKVRAEIRLLPVSGRKLPIRGSYRPNHNFFGPDNRRMAMGFIDLPDGEELYPGEAMEVQIVFNNFPELEAEIYPGREWLIQEGSKVVGIGRIAEVLPASDG